MCNACQGDTLGYQRQVRKRQESEGHSNLGQICLGTVGGRFMMAHQGPIA